MEYFRGLGSCCLDGPATGSSASETGGVASRILLDILVSPSGSVDSSISFILSPMGVLGWYLELMLEAPGSMEVGFLQGI